MNLVKVIDTILAFVLSVTLIPLAFVFGFTAIVITKLFALPLGLIRLITGNKS